MEETNKTLSFVERIKKRALEEAKLGGDYVAEDAKMGITTCTNCGAGRAKMDGLTKCAYCGFEFLKVALTDGLNIKKEDNSR